MYNKYVTALAEESLLFNQEIGIREQEGTLEKSSYN